MMFVLFSFQLFVVVCFCLICSNKTHKKHGRKGMVFLWETFTLNAQKALKHLQTAAFLPWIMCCFVFLCVWFVAFRNCLGLVSSCLVIVEVNSPDKMYVY